MPSQKTFDDLDNYNPKLPYATPETPMPWRTGAGYRSRSTRYMVAVDLEALCWDTAKIGAEAQARIDRMRASCGDPIIEIGAVCIDLHTGTIVDEWGHFTNPAEWTADGFKVSAYCTALTTITQADVDGAPDIAEVLGAFDRKAITRTWDLLGCAGAAPWGAEPTCDTHINLRNLCAMLGTPGGPEGDLKATAESMGVWGDGTHHRGIDDARAVARIALKVLGAARGAFHPA